MYKKIDQNDIAYLSSLFDEKHFFTSDDIADDYSKDEHQEEEKVVENTESLDDLNDFFKPKK